MKEDTLQQFTVPFEKVVLLKFFISGKRINNGSLALNQIFPNLEHINFIIYAKPEFNFLDVEFQKLKHVFVHPGTAWERTKGQVEGLLRKNPHLQSVYLSCFPDDYIKTVYTILPSLQNVTIHGSLDIGNDTIQFEHIKNFELRVMTPKSLDNISFSNLQSMMMFYYPGMHSTWIEFFRRHTNLTYLDFKMYMYSGDVPFDEMTSFLPNLVVVLVDSIGYVSADSIIEFIESHDQLMKFQFTIRRYSDEDKERLRQRFEHEWDIQDCVSSSKDKWPGLSFERKKYIV